jgi:phosphate-selective porin OprO/OprP
MKLKILIFSIALVIFSNGFSQQKSTDFKPTAKFGGRILFDYGVNKLSSTKIIGSEFRQLRSFITGNVTSNVSYKFQIGFASGKTTFFNVYIKYLNIPKIGGTLTIGNFKIPSGMNALTSGKFMTFVERSTLERYHHLWQTGIMYSNQLFKKIAYQIAYNTNSDINGRDTNLNQGQNITLRISGLVINNKEKRELLHIGTRFSNRVPIINDSGVRTYSLSLRPESHLATKLISQTFENVNHINSNGFEFAYTSGAFSLQSEYTSATINTQTRDYTVPSYYAFISYFLTGEHRSYKNAYSGFSRIKPLHNFDNSKGWGALEVAFRISSFNLTDANQGKLNDLTFGLNWYLNPNARIMYNYVAAKNDDLGLKNKAHLIRFQVDF